MSAAGGGQNTSRTDPESSPDTCLNIIVMEDELGAFLPVLPSGIMLFGVRATSADLVTLVNAAGAETPLATAPMLCLGFATRSEAHLPTLEAARQTFESWCGLELPSPIVLDHPEPAEALALLLATALPTRLRGYADHVSRLTRELFRLRVVHEDMMNAFADLERFVNEANVQPCRLTFENPVQPGHSITDAKLIRQVLPVSTFGLSVIEIYLEDWSTARSAISGLAAELRSLEDQEVHATWRVTLDDLRPGWLVLPLEGGLGGRQRTPELTVRPLTGLACLPGIGVGKPQSLPAFRATVTTEEAETQSPGSLAVRTWCGLPGVRPPAVDETRVAKKRVDLQRIVDIALPARVLGTAVLRSRHWQPEFSPVSFLPEFSAVEVHPAPSGEIWAEISPLLVGPAPLRLSLRGLVRSPNSKPVEFCIGFTDGNSDRYRAMIEGGVTFAPDDGMVLSGWQEGHNSSPTLLHITLPDCGGQGSLFLGTRMSAGSSNAFAWACFQDLRVTQLPKTVAKLPIGVDASADPTAPLRNEPLIVTGGLPLPVEYLATVENCLDLQIEGMPLITYDHDRRGLLCHPPASGISLARLTRFPQASLGGLVARAHVGNSRSLDIAFAIIVSTYSVTEVERRLMDDALHQDAGFLFSGWKQASYDQDELLDLTLDTPTSFHAVGVYFATKMATAGSTNDYAWAYFTDVRITTEGLGLDTRPGSRE